MDEATKGIVGIFTAVVGVAIVAVIVSNNAQTSNVITSIGNAFSSIIKSAVSPVTGSSSASSALNSVTSGINTLIG